MGPDLQVAPNVAGVVALLGTCSQEGGHTQAVGKQNPRRWEVWELCSGDSCIPLVQSYTLPLCSLGPLCSPAGGQPSVTIPLGL